MSSTWESFIVPLINFTWENLLSILIPFIITMGILIYRLIKARLYRQLPPDSAAKPVITNRPGFLKQSLKETRQYFVDNLRSLFGKKSNIHSFIKRLAEWAFSIFPPSNARHGDKINFQNRGLR